MKSKLNTFIKRLVNTISALCCMYTAFHGSFVFSNATTFVGIVQGLFWLILGWIGFWLCVEAFSQKKWAWRL